MDVGGRHRDHHEGDHRLVVLVGSAGLVRLVVFGWRINVKCDGDICGTTSSALCRHELGTRGTTREEGRRICGGFPHIGRLRGRVSINKVGATQTILTNKSIGSTISGLHSRGLTVRTRIGGVLASGNCPRGCFRPSCFYGGYGSGNCYSVGNGAIEYSYVGSTLVTYTYTRLGEGTPLSLSAFRDFGLRCCSGAISPGLGMSPCSRVDEILECYRGCTSGFGSRSRDVLVGNTAKLNGARLSLTVTGRTVGENCNMVCTSTPRLISGLRGVCFSGGRSSSAFSVLIRYSLLVVSSLKARFRSRFSMSRLCGVFGSEVLSGGPMVVGAGLAVESLRRGCASEFISEVYKGTHRLSFLNESVEVEQGWFWGLFIGGPITINYFRNLGAFLGGFWGGC